MTSKVFGMLTLHKPLKTQTEYLSDRCLTFACRKVPLLNLVDMWMSLCLMLLVTGSALYVDTVTGGLFGRFSGSAVCLAAINWGVALFEFDINFDFFAKKDSSTIDDIGRYCFWCALIVGDIEQNQKTFFFDMTLTLSPVNVRVYSAWASLGDGLDPCPPKRERERRCCTLHKAPVGPGHWLILWMKKKESGDEQNIPTGIASNST